MRALRWWWYRITGQRRVWSVRSVPEIGAAMAIAEAQTDQEKWAFRFASEAATHGKEVFISLETYPWHRQPIDPVEMSGRS